MLHFWKCDVYVEMLNGFLPRIAENEVLGFSDSMLYRALPDCEHIDCTVHCASAFCD